MRKAQHKGKRVLASALCVGMLASMVPTQAFAADEQPVAAVVQEAAPAAEEAPAENAVSTETPAEESAAEETPAPAEAPRLRRRLSRKHLRRKQLSPRWMPLLRRLLPPRRPQPPLRRRLLHLRPPRLASQQTSVWSLPESIGRIM